MIGPVEASSSVCPMGQGTGMRHRPSDSLSAALATRENKITMKYQGLPGLFGSLFLLLSCSSASAQDRVFNWLPANAENVRLDPGNYHTGRTYHPGSNGGNNHVGIKSQKPVTIFMTPESDWNAVLENPRAVVPLHQVCLREHVV